MLKYLFKSTRTTQNGLTDIIQIYRDSIIQQAIERKNIKKNILLCDPVMWFSEPDWEEICTLENL